MRLFVLVLCFSVGLCDRGRNVPRYQSAVRSYVETPIYNDANPWETNEIYRPCSTRDLTCIRQFFARNSYCTPTYGPPPDPYPIPRLPLLIPHANMTFIWNNAQARGLKDAVIKDFYINKTSNKLVLEIEVPEISVFSPASIARYHRKGREPIELSDKSFISYKMVSLTMVVPFVHGIQMDRAEVYSYIGVSRPSTNIGPGLSNTDPEIQRSYNTLLGNMSISMREAFIAQGPLHVSVFLESSICSFRNNLMY